MYSYIIAVRYTMNFDLTEDAKKQLDYMIARRRYLHRHPCVSFHEEDARDYLATEIAALGPDTLRPRKTPASCTPAATTATRQPCWACCDL